MANSFGSLSSSSNDYRTLKWLLTIVSVATTVVAFIIVISFRSNEWFMYESINNDSRTYGRTGEHGSIGLWYLCSGHIYAPADCDAWTKATRPANFNVVLMLFACTLLITNLTVFPSYATVILIAYNHNDRYRHHISALIYILLVLALAFTILLIASMIFISLTQFYSPGRFIVGTKYLYFHQGFGLYMADVATVLSVIILILIIITIIWRKYIEMQRLEAEKELLRQISDENYRPGWYKIKLAPTPKTTFPTSDTPPPYEAVQKQTVYNNN